MSIVSSLSNSIMPNILLMATAEKIAAEMSEYIEECYTVHSDEEVNRAIMLFCLHWQCMMERA